MTTPPPTTKGFPGSSDGKESAYYPGEASSIPGLGGSPGKGKDNPLQYSCLENSMDRRAWWATVHGVAKSWTRLSNEHLLILKGRECGILCSCNDPSGSPAGKPTLYVCLPHLLPEFPRTTSPVSCLLSRPCLRLCFWRTHMKTTVAYSFLLIPAPEIDTLSTWTWAGGASSLLLVTPEPAFPPALGSQGQGLCLNILDPTQEACIQILLN